MTAPKTFRGRVNALNRILETHKAFEQRTLADLRNAGFDFQTIDRARRYQQARFTVANMTPDELTQAFSDMTNKREAS